MRCQDMRQSSQYRSRLVGNTLNGKADLGIPLG